MGNKAILKRLFQYVKPHGFKFLLAIAGMVVVALTEPAVAALMQPMIDGTFIDKDPQAIIWVPLGFIALFFVRGAGRLLAAFGLNEVATRVVMQLRVDLHKRVQSLPQSFMDETTSGHLLSKITYDVEQLASAISDVWLSIVRDSLTIIFLMSYMFYVNWQLTAMVLFAAPVIAVIIKLVSKAMRRFSKALQHDMGELTHRLEESLRGHKLIKLYQAEEQEQDKFFNVVNRLRRNKFRLAILNAANSPVIQLVVSISLAAVIYVAAVLDDGQAMSAGAFVSFFFAMGMLFSPIRSLTSVTEPFQRGMAAAESVFGLIDQYSEPNSGSKTLERFTGKLELKAVSFQYAGTEEYVLKQVSLCVQPGETVALVGASGSGKTTLTQLIPRFYDATSGAIELDGIDSRELTLTSLRKQIAYVDQEVMLFGISVAENVAYGSEETPDIDKVRAALIHAHALDFVENLEDGINTNIGEEGALLSGGQRQRLALARAFYKDAKLLILDEATSALDNESERQVQLALNKLCKGRTTIIIAHRLSTIEHADRIVVMEHGEIMEIGNHQELMDLQGAYYSLYQHLS